MVRARVISDRAAVFGEPEIMVAYKDSGFFWGFPRASPFYGIDVPAEREYRDGSSLE